MKLDREKKSNKLNILVFTFIMLDFLLTYFGINNIGCIAEANPIMVCLFELPFIYSFLVRMVLGLFMYFLLKIIQEKGHKYYKKVITFALIANSIIMVSHIHWLFMEFVILKR